MFYLSYFSPSSNVTNSNCSNGVQWIWTVMGDCVVTDNQIASTYFGLGSIVVWMLCGIPQMIQNCKNLGGMAGISFLLMFQWLLGDVTNLIGSILTNQLKVQIYVAVWYVTADLVLLSQYIAYRYQKRRLLLDVKNKNIQVVLCLGGLFLMGSLKSLQQLSPLDNSFSIHHPSGRNLLMTSQVGHIHMFKNNVELTGYIIGAVSAVFYIGSRLSQIYTNYSRSSTEGLAKIMFWLAVLGNLLYGLAIVVRDIDGVFILQHLPWIIGSLGVIFLDVTLLCQFYYYERRNFNSLSRQPLLPEENSSSPICISSD
ncbi:hypothetical protein SNE40_013401 [Patella caerulea]|uniref:Uncharacterized protein n=1 Tax=Patella caerulea TaxID=87958 RepID=A0AAN8JFR9_PATCE